MDRYSRPDVIVDGDHATFRASSIGGCPKALALGACADSDLIDERPAPPGPWLRNAWEESSALEQQAFDLWHDMWNTEHNPIDVLDEPLECSIRLDSETLITGTVDGRVIIDDEPATVEIKVVGENLFEELDRHLNTPWGNLPAGQLVRKYRTQCGVYAHAYNQPVVLVVCEKKNGGLTGRVTARMYPVETTLLPSIDDLVGITDEIRDHIHVIKRDGNLHCSIGSSNCSWSAWCRHVESTDSETDELVGRLNELQHSAKLIDEEIASIKATLAAVAQTAGGKAVTPSGHKLTWVEQQVAERVVKAHERKFLKVTYNKNKNKETP